MQRRIELGGLHRVERTAAREIFGRRHLRFERVARVGSHRRPRWPAAVGFASAFLDAGFF